MLGLILITLCVFMFGAYAYGAALVLTLREVPVWSARRASPDQMRVPLEPVTLTLCAICTVWFVLQAYLEFQLLGPGGPGRGLIPDLMSLVLTYSFPPLIMHVVLKGTHAECKQPLGRFWHLLPAAMYVLTLGWALFLMLAIFGYIPRPRPFGAWAGIPVGAASSGAVSVGP